MHFFWFRVFPIVLWVCSLGLGLLELRSPAQEGRPRRRLIRVSGCLLLAALGAMIWCGRLPTVLGTDPAVAYGVLRYWGLVFCVLLVLCALALLDSLEGARALKSYLEGVETEEVARIREHLRERRAT